jgi:transcriptional regulatory protein RtcR
MATLADGGRITVEDVAEEIQRLRSGWSDGRDRLSEADIVTGVLGETAAAELDRFDRVQLADVLTVIRECKNLSEAGRRLFAVSRTSKKRPNDADRLRKYLDRFGIDWRKI